MHGCLPFHGVSILACLVLFAAGCPAQGSAAKVEALVTQGEKYLEAPSGEPADLAIAVDAAAEAMKLVAEGTGSTWLGRAMNATHHLGLAADERGSTAAREVAWRALVDHFQGLTEPDEQQRGYLWFYENRLSNALGDGGKLERALEFQKQIYEREKAKDAYSQRALAASQDIAVTYGRMLLFADALELLRKVCEDLKREHGDSLLYHHVRRNLATTMGDSGLTWHEDLLVIQREALERYENPRPGETVSIFDVETARWELAQTYLQQKDYDRARTHAVRALENMMNAEGLGEKHGATAQARGILAIIHMRLGDFDDAIRLFQKNLVVQRELLPEGDPVLCRILANLGQAKLGKGETREGLECIRSAIAGLKDSPSSMRQLQEAREGLTDVLLELGKNEEALQVAQEMVAVVSEFKREARVIEQALRGACLQRTGQAEEAVKVFAEYMDAVIEAASFHEYSMPLRCYVWALYELEDKRAMVAQLHKLLETTEKVRLNTATLAGRQSLELAQLIDTNSQFAMWMANKAPAKDKEELQQRAFLLLESLRGVAYRTTRTFRVATENADIRQKRTREWIARNKLRELTWQRRLGDDSVTPEQIAEAASERDTCESEVRKALSTKGLVTPDLTLPDIRKALGSTIDAVIAYRRMRTWGPGGAQPRDKDRLVAHVVLRRDRSLLHEIDLKEVHEIDELVRAWRNDILADKPATDSGEKLRERIWDPVRKKIGTSCKRVVVCLDGSLHTVPIDALPAKKPKKIPIGEDIEIRFENSLLRFVDPAPKPKGRPSLLAIGGVDFDADTERASVPGRAARLPAKRGGGGAAWVALEGSSQEVADIDELFRNSKLPKGDVEILKGKEATRTSFGARSEGKRYLHLATHGSFAGADSAAGSGGAILGDAVLGYAPMTLCYLVFAGANSKNPERSIMTAEEVAGLDLSACDLAVLSACQTYEGISREGHGVQSLQAALHAAGARSTITSLWDVDDAATRQLMHAFYDGLWTKRYSKVKALREAKKKLRKDDHPPSHWAGWILTGDPDGTP